MENCMFCEIALKKKNAHMVYEDNEFIAFLDRKPRTKGHSLVLPRKHYRWVDEVPNVGRYFEIARGVARSIRKALQPDWLQFFTIGEEVHHAHIHVLPRYVEDGHGALPNLSEVKNVGDSDMRKIAQNIRRNTD